MPIHRIESGVAPAQSRLITEYLNDADDVAAGVELTRTFTPPIGYIWRIVGMQLSAGTPPGGSSGTHRFRLVNESITFITGTSNYNNSVAWLNSHWESATFEKLPPENETALLAISQAIFTNDSPISIKYYNNTDVNATGLRVLRFYIEETPIT